MAELVSLLTVRTAAFWKLAIHWQATWRFWMTIGRLPRLCPPVNQNDKFMWRKLFDHNPQFEIFCDKLASKAWTREKCPRLPVANVLWEGNSASDIPAEFFERPSIIKASNGSGYNITTGENGPTRHAVEHKFCRWLSRPYGQANAEWGYRNVPRKVFVEQLITGADGAPPVMILVFACSGKPASAYCIVG